MRRTPKPLAATERTYERAGAHTELRYDILRGGGLRRGVRPASRLSGACEGMPGDSAPEEEPRGDRKLPTQRRLLGASPRHGRQSERQRPMKERQRSRPTESDSKPTGWE